jgi:hypothetical protein
MTDNGRSVPGSPVRERESVGQSVSRSVGQSVSRSVGQSVSQSVLKRAFSLTSRNNSGLTTPRSRECRTRRHFEISNPKHKIATRNTSDTSSHCIDPAAQSFFTG